MFLCLADKPYPQIEKPGDQAEPCQPEHEKRGATAAPPSLPTRARGTDRTSCASPYSSQQAAPTSGSPEQMQKIFVHRLS
jgi:hypothetical protein